MASEISDDLIWRSATTTALASEALMLRSSLGTDVKPNMMINVRNIDWFIDYCWLIIHHWNCNSDGLLRLHSSEITWYLRKFSRKWLKSTYFVVFGIYPMFFLLLLIIEDHRYWNWVAPCVCKIYAIKLGPCPFFFRAKLIFFCKNPVFLVKFRVP